MKGVVIAVCLAAQKGQQKKEVPIAQLLRHWGIEGDAHAGSGHRQVSLLSYEKVQKFNIKGAGVNHGDFGENLIIDGIDLAILPVGTLLRCGSILLEISQIGKECHTRCPIFNKMGDCIMPREGVFARVLQEGYIRAGIPIEVVTSLKAAVLTISDKGAKGQRENQSYPLAQQILEESGYAIVQNQTLPDEQQQIEDALIELADTMKVDLVITSGGTGLSKRDVTPEATLAVAERAVPGIAEAIRAHSVQITKRAILGRGVSVIRGGTLIVNLPGSPKAVQESLRYILPHLAHGIEIPANSICPISTKCFHRVNHISVSFGHLFPIAI